MVDQNYLFGLFRLAYMYERGKGTKVNLEEALKLYAKGLKDTDLTILIYLGFLEMKINGDEEVGIKQLTQKVKKGSAEAQYYFGNIYSITERHTEAVKWFEKSASRGNKEAQYRLALAYESGEGVRKNLAKAKYWMQQAAKNGHKEAQMKLRD